MSKISVVFILCLICLAACRKDAHDTEHPSDLPLKDAAKVWFENKVPVHLNDPSRKPDWAGAKEYRLENGTAVEVPIVTSQPVAGMARPLNSARVAPEKDADIYDYSTLIVYRDKEGRFSYRVMSIVAEGAYASKKQKLNSFLKVDQGFSGTVFFQDWQGKPISGYRYYNGKRVQRLLPAGSNGLARLDCVTYTIDYYQKTCVGSYCSEWKYLYSRSWTTCTEVPGEDEESDWIDDGTGGTGGGGGGGTGGGFPPDYPREETGQQQFVDTIALDETMNPCLLSTVNYVIDKGMQNELSKMINDVFGAAENVHLYFRESYTMDDTDAGNANASRTTTRIEVTITLNANKLPYASKEYIAATILHEALHAYMRVSNINSNFDHTDMAARYITKMADALREMFPGIDSNGQIADALAWGGLHGTNVWTYKVAAEPVRANDILSINHSHFIGVAGEPCPN